MTKVVFLDIDGVLNYQLMPRNRPPDGSVWFRDRVAQICPDRTKLLNQIHAKFVLSSSWRYVVEIDVMQRMLAYRGFTGKLLGRTPKQAELKGKYTPENPSYGAPRGYEIAEWLDDNPVQNCVIVDDNTDMAHLKHRLVKTDPLVGLTQADVDKIKEMLT
jgi:hypothetical protein